MAFVMARCKLESCGLRAPFPMLNTETPSTRHPDLDTYATPALLLSLIHI